MSHWIDLADPRTGETMDLPERHQEGGTYVLGGTDQAELNVTYNYGRLMAEHQVHVVSHLHGKRAADTIPALQAAVDALGTVAADDYWDPTPGNVGRCCQVLLRWAHALPDGIWWADEGDALVFPDALPDEDDA